MIGAPTSIERAIEVIETEAARHRLGPSEGRTKDCQCGGWTGSNGALAGFRDHVVTAILDRLRREAR